MTDTTTELKPGDRRRDGTVFAGISPDTQRPMYTTPADAPLTYRFNEAAEYAGTLNAQKFLGHRDWRVPTRGELNVLYNNRAAIGGFDENTFDPAWYWSSSQDAPKWAAWSQRFSDGDQNYWGRGNDWSVRCVRG